MGHDARRGGDVARALEGELQVKVSRLCQEGERRARAGEHGEALAAFIEAWELLPEPRESWEVAGDVYRGFTRIIEARADLADGIERLLTSRADLGAVLAVLDRLRGGVH